jgi:hypothetical protein
MRPSARPVPAVLSAVLLSGALSACGRSDDPTGFGDGGKNYVNDPFDGDTGGGSATDDSPTISNLSVALEDFADLGEVIVVRAYYSDPNGDFPYSDDGTEAGRVLLTVTEGEVTLDELAVTVGSGGAAADEDEGFVMTAISDIDPDVTYGISVIIEDVAGNRSDPMEGQYSPAE